jgi:hypothetical protein
MASALLRSVTRSATCSGVSRWPDRVAKVCRYSHWSRPPHMSTCHSAARACALAVVLVALVTALPASTAIAQRPDSLSVGSHLRVKMWTTPPGQLTGVLEAADSNAMFLVPHGRPPMLLQYTEIESIAIARGREPRPGGAARGAKRGFLVGASIGLLATAIAFTYDVNSSSDTIIPASVVIGVYSLGLTAVTTGVGALIGRSYRTRWERVWPQ